MRIRLDGSSASSASSVDGEEAPTLHYVGTLSPQGQQRGASETPRPMKARPLLVHHSSSSLSLAEDETPEPRRVTHLDRANQARRLSMATTSLHRQRKAASPVWMRSSSKAVDSASDSCSDPSDLSESDSEEDEWPVAPNRLGASRRAQLLLQRQASMEAQDVAQRIRLSGESGDGISHHRVMVPRRFKYRPDQSPEVVSAQARAKAERAKADFDEVQTLLAELKLKKEGEEAEERRAFEARNKALWDTIEAGIRKEEEKREQAAKEEQEKLRRARELREAAERRAMAMKAEEEARILQEKEEEQRRAKEVEEARQAEEERAKQAEREEKARNVGGVGVSLDREAREAFEHWWGKMEHVKTNVLPVVSQNAEWRKQCFTAKRSITRGVSQLTNSRTEIVRITQSIGEVLVQARGATASGEIYTWILNHLSKCLIRQAEQEVAAKQDMAFPLARIVVGLLLEGHEQLGDILMARLVKKCCWCLPHCPGKKAGQDDAAHAKVLGKASLEEATFAYTTRMSGIIAFYFAICQTKPTSPPSGASLDVKLVPTQFRMKALWTWQARAMSPRLLDQSLSPALWSTLIEVAGPSLLATYGKQTGKVWRLMLTEGIENEKAGFCKSQAANSAKVRLKQLLGDWSRTGTVQGATTGRQMDV